MEEHSRDVKMKMKIKGLFCFFLLLKMCSSCDASRTVNTESQKLNDIDKYLKRINKTPVKTIKSPDGDIIDCVDIYKQPAFDHPLLKHHKIQMRPNHYPEGLFAEKNTKDIENSDRMIHQLWQKNGRCPEGTIPIRRTTKEDLLRADSIERFGMKSPGSIPRSEIDTDYIIDEFDHEHAMVVIEGDYFMGAKANINLWQPEVQPASNESSSSQIWIIGGPDDFSANTIEAGWHVSPDMYGDNNTRLFVYWTSDHYRTTGCYNLQCSGFVQTNQEVILGGTFTKMSNYSTKDQFQITLQIFKSDDDGKWWLTYGKGIVAGYWPTAIFNLLKVTATRIQMGGEVINHQIDGKHTTTQMGSGHFSKEGFMNASFFNHIQIANATYVFKDPDAISTSYMVPNCYNLDQNVKVEGDWGVHFFYGGPGRNPDCP